MLRESFTLIAFLGASFFYSWRLTLGSLLIAPIIAVLTARFGTSLRNLARESFEGNKRLTDTAQEALANHTIVKAYRAEARESLRFTTVAKTIVRANLRTARIVGFAPPTIEMIGVVFVVLLLFFGQREIVSGRMSAAQFLTFLFFLFVAMIRCASSRACTMRWSRRWRRLIMFGKRWMKTLKFLKRKTLLSCRRCVRRSNCARFPLVMPTRPSLCCAR